MTARIIRDKDKPGQKPVYLLTTTNHHHIYYLKLRLPLAIAYDQITYAHLSPTMTGDLSKR